MKKYILFISMVIPIICNAQTKIIMEKVGGVFTFPCVVNGLDLKFIFDTGASDVTISLSEANFMLKNGYLKNEDIIGTSKTQIASGDIIDNSRIILHEINVSGIILTNVSAIVVHTQYAPLLFGQSAIQKLGKLQISGNELLILNGNNAIQNNGITEDVAGALSYLSKGFECFDKGLYNLAIENLKTSISKSPTYLAYFLLGNTYEKLGNNQEAIKCYEQTIYLFPKYANAYYDLGGIYLDEGNNMTAIDFYRKTIEINPQDFEAYYNLGIAYKNMNLLSVAIDAFSNCISLNPEYADAYCNRGVTYYNTGYKKAAIYDLKKASKLGSEDARDNLRKLGYDW